MKFIFSFFYFLPILIFSQFNESDTLKFKANLSLTGFWQGGNVQTLIFRAKSEISIKPYRKWVFKTQNSYVYQAFNKVKADEDVLSLNFIYFDPDKKIYPLVLGFASTNFRREIKWRSLYGAGVTFQVVNQKKHLLKFSLSSEYEQTNFGSTLFNKSQYDGNEDVNTYRGTFWVKGKNHFFEKKMIFDY